MKFYYNSLLEYHFNFHMYNLKYNIYILNCLQKNWKFQDSQYSFRSCSAMLVQNLSHFDSLTKMFPSFKVGGSSHCDVKMTAPSNFEWREHFCQWIKMAQIWHKHLPSTIWSYTENLGFFDFFEDSLLGSTHMELL